MQEAPQGGNEKLLEFHVRLHELKTREMAKKAEGLHYDPHFDDIDPDSLGEYERLAYEDMPNMTDEEFETLKEKRFADMKPSPEDIERYKKELTPEQFGPVSRLISGSGILPKTFEEKSAAAFWAFLDNVRRGLSNKRS